LSEVQIVSFFFQVQYKQSNEVQWAVCNVLRYVSVKN